MERTFFSVLGGCLAFLLSGGALLFLGWLLWWLWSRQRKEEEEAAAEIELEATDVGRGSGAVTGLVEEEVPPVEEEPAVREPVPPEPGDVDEPGAVRAVEIETPAAPVPEPVSMAEIEGPGGPDDLRVIEGIGPRIAGVLRAGGIRTFRQLADTDVAHIEGILVAEDPRLLRLCKPDTWPEQAALAAAGDWKGLEALTAELKGGRRV